MGARVVIQWEGLEQTISRLTQIEEKGQQNLQTLTKDLGDDTETAWKQATPKGKTKQLSEGDKATPAELSFTLNNSVHYYKFVDEGHKTPLKWRTKHGFRYAKKQSYVKGREMTKAAVQFITDNITKYLSKFLDNV